MCAADPSQAAAAARAVAPAPRITTWPLIAILWELSD